MSLTTVDPERYGSLSHPGDAFSFDMYCAGRCGRPGAEGTVLAELAVDRVDRDRRVAVGVPAHDLHQRRRPLTPVYDGFFVHARGRSGSPLDASGADARPVGTARALPRRPPRAGALLRSRDRPDRRSATSGAPARQRQVPRSGRWRAPRTPTCTRSWPGSSTAARCPIAELAAAWMPTTAPLGMALEQPVNAGPQHYVLQAALAHFDRWLRDGTPPPRRASPGSARRRPARSSSSTTTATRVAASAPRTSTCPSPSSRGMGNDGAAIRAPLRHDDPVQRRATRVALLEQGRLHRRSSTPPPTPRSPRAGSSKPTPPRSRPSPPSCTPPDNEPASSRRV